MNATDRCKLYTAIYGESGQPFRVAPGPSWESHDWLGTVDGENEVPWGFPGVYDAAAELVIMRDLGIWEDGGEFDPPSLETEARDELRLELLGLLMSEAPNV